MFYLRNFKKLLKHSPIILLCYVIMGISVSTLVCNSSSISKTILKLSKTKIKAPFFHALIDNKQSYVRYSRKLRSLPGVKEVLVLSPEKMEVEAVKILGDLDFDLSSDLLNIGYAGLKVIFESNLKIESMDLVRDYLKRLVGDQNITMGELVKTKSKEKSTGLLSIILSNTQEVLIGSVLLLWLITNFILAKVFNNPMYLIQNFQRQNHIPFKMYLINAILFILVPSCLFLVLKFSMVSAFVILAAFVIGAIPHFKKLQWQSK